MALRQKSRRPSRRDIMQVGAGAILSAPFIRAPSAKAAEDVDVIVIGAGIAGLKAAKDLQSLGYETIVLEASDHVGGRIKTDWSLGAPFEEGAGWIHGPDGNPISALAAAAGANPRVTPDDSLQVFSADGVEVPGSKIDSSFEELEDLHKEIDEKFDDDQPLSQAMQKISASVSSEPIVRWMSSAYTEFDMGASLDRISAYWFDEENEADDDAEFSGDDVILANGYDLIPKMMAKDLDVRRNTRVKSISYEEGDGATVTTDNGIFESSYVVCTAPLGVLKKRQISFDPPLPNSVTSRIDKIGMGTVTKLALKFPQAFWPTDVQYFGLMTETRGRWNYFLNYKFKNFSSENILMGLSFGDYAFVADAKDDAAMVADCMDAVRTMFGNYLPEPNAHLATRWSGDPNTFGAYSYRSVGSTPDDFNGLSRPIAGTIVLAGEHTTFRHNGTVHGAFQSGQRAAKIIDDELAD